MSVSPFACAVCRGRGFCWCAQRYEDLLRESAEVAADCARWERSCDEGGEQWQAMNEDDALEHDRAHGYERRQQMADRYRRD